ncbi:MAG: glycosyltransferase [Caulobacteraceae bacterium]|nr:glycosyltransferase [Caulobacteraceae bacterium]
MKPRVLVIEPAGNLWGSERALLDLLSSLDSFEAAVCCPPNTPLAVELARRGVQVLPFFIADLHLKSRWERARAAIGVWRACRRFRPDLIYLNQAGAYRVCLPAAGLLGLPIVAHVRIFEDAAYLARQSPAPRRLRALIAISGAIDQALADCSGLAALPRRTVYDAYVPEGPPSAAADHSARRIACIGRITPIKGQDLLIEALALALPGLDGCDCVIAGDGDPNLVASWRRRSEASPIPIEWTGPLRDVRPLLARSAILACPSRREPLGRVIFEAWDAGLVPVVFGASGGAAEIVGAAGGGIICAQETSQALAEGLAQAVALTPAAAQRLVEAGRDWMAAHTSPQTYGRAIEAIFHEAVDDSPRVSPTGPLTSSSDRA